MTADQLKKAAEDAAWTTDENGKKVQDERQLKAATKKIGKILSDCFRGISEFFVFSSVTLALFIDLLPDPVW